MKTLDELGAAPSPWSVRDIVPIGQGRDDATGKWLVDGDGNDLVMDIDGNSIEEITATANLISAAPELYRALVKMQEAFDYIRKTAWFIEANFASISIMNDAQNVADKAITKAAGESEAK